VVAAASNLPSERYSSKRKFSACDQKQSSTKTVETTTLVQNDDDHIFKKSNNSAIETTPTYIKIKEEANINSGNEIATAPSQPTMQPILIPNPNYQQYLPKMSKLTLNIGFGKFLSMNPQAYSYKPLPFARPEHHLRYDCGKSGTPQEKRELSTRALDSFYELPHNFPVSSNFVHEHQSDSKSIIKEVCRVSAIQSNTNANEEIDLLALFETVDATSDFAVSSLPSSQMSIGTIESYYPRERVPEDYIPTFDEAIFLRNI
jgi:hypothetical protein